MGYNYDDLTEKPPSVDPTQQAGQYGWANPYMKSPYEEPSDLPPPPPPSKKRKPGLLWVISGALLVVMLLLLSFIVYGLYGNSHVSTGNNSTPVPTTVSTPTVIIETPTPQQATPTLSSSSPLPNPSIPYYANDIYNYFVANGLGGSDPKQDTKWSCCTYVPAGGAVYWTDNQSNHTLDIATFYNNHDAETDARDLMNNGFGTTVVHACLLSYDTGVPANVISLYLQVMQQYCV